MSSYTRRVDTGLSTAFAKNAGNEDFLEHLNLLLRPQEEAQWPDHDQERFPTLHVIGAPRSGTTLLYQVLASGLDVGYINNLSAAFWLAPSYGVRLTRTLGLHQLSSGFESTYGRTHGVSEPHEFGYFWSHHLRYPDMRDRGADHEPTIDWAALRRSLVTMADAHGGPMVFKPMLVAWHMERLAAEMPRTRFVWVRRSPRDTALSLLTMRQSLYGDLTRWASLRPDAPELDAEPPWRQVAAQVVLVEQRIRRAAAALGPDVVYELPYAELCADPVAVLTHVRDMLGEAGFAPSLRTPDMAPFRATTGSRLEDEFGARVDDALAHFTQVYDAAEPSAD